MMNRIHTALVMDGDFLMRGHVAEALQSAGMTVLEAVGKEDAIRIMASGNIDVVFADLNLISTLERNKVYTGKPGVRPYWVITTSFGTVDRAIEYVKRGVYDYLIKPFSPLQVSVILSRLYDTHRLHETIDELEHKLGREAEGEYQPAPDRSSFSVVGGTTNLQELERETILRVMHETDGCRGMMAKKLGISVRTLRNKLNRYREEAALV